MRANYKRVFIISSVVFICVACIWLAYKYKKAGEIVDYEANPSVAAALVLVGNNLSEADSDKDGLKDWEESLWGTDPHNPDTDGDGTPDGTEAQLKRNPLVKGPNDSLDQYPMGTTATSNQRLTQSDLLSQELFARYSEAKAQNGTLSADDQAAILQSVIASAEKTIERPVQYKLSTLNIIQNPTQGEIAQYAILLKAALLTQRGPGVGNEMALLLDAVQTRDDSNLGDVDAISAFYNKAASSLLKIRVPAPIAADHLAIVNDYLQLAKNVTAFKSVITDPFVTSVNFSDYVKNSGFFELSFKNIDTYLKNNNVDISQ